MRDRNTGRGRDAWNLLERRVVSSGAHQPEPVMYSVLLVDASVALREALARSLTRRGCRVTTAGSGLEAVELLRAQSVDVVITDCHMPERGGLWLWRQALALRPELRGRFVLVASEPLPARESLSLFLETERFLLKPLSLDSLWREIQDVMRRATPPGAARRFQSPESSAPNVV
jgi:two-component system response regulator GlrR